MSQRLLAKEFNGPWHASEVNYPSSAVTVCGRQIQVSFFDGLCSGEWPGLDLRPDRCPDCLEKLLARGVVFHG